MALLLVIVTFKYPISDYYIEGGKNQLDKQRDLLSKTLVVGVIVLFIGVGIQPVFADNPTPISEEVYENSDCFVVGRSTRTLKMLSGLFSRIILFP